MQKQYDCKYCDYSNTESNLIEFHMFSFHYSEFLNDLIEAGIIKEVKKK